MRFVLILLLSGCIVPPPPKLSPSLRGLSVALDLTVTGEADDLEVATSALRNELTHALAESGYVVVTEKWRKHDADVVISATYDKDLGNPPYYPSVTLTLQNDAGVIEQLSLSDNRSEVLNTARMLITKLNSSTKLAAIKRAAPTDAVSPRLAEVITVLFIDMRATEEMPPNVSRTLSQLLLATLSDVPNLKMTSFDDVQQMLSLERKKDLLGCSSATCMAEIGGALGTDVILYGDVGKLGSKYAVNLTLVDSKGGTVRGRVSILTAANEDALGAEVLAISDAIVKKLSP